MERKRREGNHQRRHYKKPAPGRFAMVATTMQGLEDVLARELSRIGANDVSPAKRAVYFTADKDLVYKANLRLRTALR
ncbi:MAG: hypothetical protein ABR572_02495, partial [Cryomorphaceae bacterium]